MSADDCPAELSIKGTNTSSDDHAELLQRSLQRASRARLRRAEPDGQDQLSQGRV